MKFFKLISFTFLIFAFSANSLFAATLSLSPSSGSYENGKTFSVNINVASPDQAMNAASATINFPVDKLQVVSVSKSGSIIDFWAQEPTFSNSSGTVRFEGVALTPGYQGVSGRIITINFRGKAAGLAGVTITGSSVLANDGIGSNILKAVANGSFTITEAPPPAPREEVIDLEELKPIEEDQVKEEVCEPDSLIYSTTHPGQIWRKENTAVFSWDIGDDIVASRIAFDKNPNTNPETLNKPAIVEKKYENLEDGTWYFHLSLQDNDGWSEPEHFRIKIDTTPPEIELKEILREDKTNPKPVISLNITDKTSCVKNFIISVDGVPVDYNKLPNGNLELETIDPGQHELAVVAYDRAGNQNESYLDIFIEALPEPEITDFNSDVKNSAEIFVRGETIQNANLTAKITSRKNSFLAREDFQSGSGKFTWTPGTKLKNGTYFVSFKVTDTRGASSYWTKPVTIRVGSGVAFDPKAFFDSIPPQAFIGILVLFGVLMIVFVTRALTIRSYRRRHDEEYWK